MPVAFIAVHTRIEAAQKSVESAVSTPNWEAVCKEKADDIVQLLSGATFSHDEGQALKSLILESLFPKLTKADVCAKISECSAKFGNNGQKGFRQKLQNFTNFPKITPDVIWNLAMDKKVSAHTKHETFSKFLVEVLGLRNPSEPTFQMISVILHLCIGENPSQKERELQFEFLKAQLRSWAKECEAQPTNIEVLPADLESLFSMAPHLREQFKEFTVSQCPFRPATIFAMKKLYPMRQKRFGPTDLFSCFEDNLKARREIRCKRDQMAIEGGLKFRGKQPDTVHDRRSSDSPLMAAIQDLSSKVAAISDRSVSSPLAICDSSHVPPAGGVEAAVKGGSVGAFVDDSAAKVLAGIKDRAMKKKLKKKKGKLSLEEQSWSEAVKVFEAEKAKAVAKGIDVGGASSPLAVKVESLPPKVAAVADKKKQKKNSKKGTKPVVGPCKESKGCAHVPKGLKRPAAVLGCSKCRYLKFGCKSCRPAGFAFPEGHVKYHKWVV